MSIISFAHASKVIQSRARVVKIDFNWDQSLTCDVMLLDYNGDHFYKVDISKNDDWSDPVYHDFRIQKRHRGRVMKDLMHAVDWYPTILSMAGADHDDDTDIDGLDMWTAIKTNVAGQRKELIYNINDALR